MAESFVLLSHGLLLTFGHSVPRWPPRGFEWPHVAFWVPGGRGWKGGAKGCLGGVEPGVGQNDWEALSFGPPHAWAQGASARAPFDALTVVAGRDGFPGPR